MTSYGVCESSEERCGLSLESSRVDRLFELLRIINARQIAGENPAELVGADLATAHRHTPASAIE